MKIRFSMPDGPKKSVIKLIKIGVVIRDGPKSLSSIEGPPNRRDMTNNTSCDRVFVFGPHFPDKVDSIKVTLEFLIENGAEINNVAIFAQVLVALLNPKIMYVNSQTFANISKHSSLHILVNLLRSMGVFLFCKNLYFFYNLQKVTNNCVNCLNTY